MSTQRNAIVFTAAAAVWSTIAIAADVAPSAPANASGALPGDDTLTCEQIFAQGMAESQKDQQARAQRNEQQRRELTGLSALVTGAALTGGMGGTGIAANNAAQVQADKTIAMANAPQPTNPRLDHLKQLYAQKHCTNK